MKPPIQLTELVGWWTGPTVTQPFRRHGDAGWRCGAAGLAGGHGGGAERRDDAAVPGVPPVRPFDENLPPSLAALCARCSAAQGLGDQGLAAETAGEQLCCGSTTLLAPSVSRPACRL